MFLTLDYQYIWNMAFNSDRGDIGIWAIRHILSYRDRTAMAIGAD